MMQTIVSSPFVAPPGGYWLTMAGGAAVTLHRGNGSVEELGGVQNQNTSVGRNFLAQWISSYSTGANSQMSHVAIGAGTTPASANQSVLVTERARKAFASAAVTANCWTVTTTYGGGSDSVAGIAITEIGVFNDARSAQGVMWNRILLTTNTFTLQNSDIATVKVWTVVGTG